MLAHAPSRCLAGILRSLTGHLQPEAFATLSQFHQVLQQYLRVTQALKAAAPGLLVASQSLAQLEEDDNKSNTKLPGEVESKDPAGDDEENEDDQKRERGWSGDESVQQLQDERLKFLGQLEAQREAVRVLGLDPKKALLKV